jgi:hypothetical protein
MIEHLTLTTTNTDAEKQKWEEIDTIALNNPSDYGLSNNPQDAEITTLYLQDVSASGTVDRYSKKIGVWDKSLVYNNGIASDKPELDKQQVFSVTPLTNHFDTTTTKIADYSLNNCPNLTKITF